MRVGSGGFPRPKLGRPIAPRGPGPPERVVVGCDFQRTSGRTLDLYTLGDGAMRGKRPRARGTRGITPAFCLLEAPTTRQSRRQASVIDASPPGRRLPRGVASRRGAQGIPWKARTCGGEACFSERDAVARRRLVGVAVEVAQPPRSDSLRRGEARGGSRFSGLLYGIAGQRVRRIGAADDGVETSRARRFHFLHSVAGGRKFYEHTRAVLDRPRGSSAGLFFGAQVERDERLFWARARNRPTTARWSFCARRPAPVAGNRVGLQAAARPDSPRRRKSPSSGPT